MIESGYMGFFFGGQIFITEIIFKNCFTPERKIYMKKIISGIQSHNLIILFISLLLIAGGVFSYIYIPKEEMPNIETTFGYVQITAPGLNSKEVSENIADPIEDIINDYSNVKDYTTTSMDNACIILVEMDFDDDTSVESLEKLKTDVLNSNVDDNITDINFVTDVRTGEAIYAVYSDDLSEFELKELAERLAEHISGVDKIAKTVVNSAYSEEIVVTANYDKLNSLPITLSDIYNVIVANAARVPLGTAEFDDENSSVLIDSFYGDLDEIRDLVLFADTSDPESIVVYTVGDVATVLKKDTEDKKKYEFNSHTTAFIEVFFEENIDYTVLGDELTDAVEEFKDEMEEEAEITAMTFSPDYVYDQVNSVITNLFLCIAIVMFVVMVGLGLRNSIAIAFTIPVIVMATIGILYILGSHLQLMSIAGLIVSIGILVDNSIVISEAVQHELDRGADMKLACQKAISTNFLPVLTSTLTTVAAFVPLMYLPGIAGDVAFTLPLTILTAISLSFIVAMTVTPTLAKYLFKPKKIRKKASVRFSKKVRRAMKKVFSLSLVPTILAFGLLGWLAYEVIDKLEIDILPKTEKSIVYIDYEYKRVDDNRATYRFAQKIEDVVKEQENVVNYAFSQGGDLPKFYMTLAVINNLPSNGRFFIEYDVESKDLEESMKTLEKDLKDLESEGTIVVNRLELNQPSAPVKVLLQSTDYETLFETAELVFAEVSELDSFKTGSLVAPKNKTDIKIEVDRQKINSYGLTVAEVQQQIALALNGLSDDLYSNGGDMLSVRVITKIGTKDDLLDLMIRTSTGEQIPLSDLIELSDVESIEYIETSNGVPSVTIEAYMADGYSTYQLERDIKDILDENTDNNIEAVYKGDNELTNELFGGIILSFAIALLVIFLIMYFQFKSFRQPIIILVSIPLSFIGALVAMLVFKENITLTALLGMMSLVGIVVNNGILLVEYINRHHEKGHSIYKSCIKAVERRLRPILLSSLTTIFGLIPLAVFGGDFFRPMAVTFMGGMITSTLLVLFVIPSLYYFTYKKRDKIANEKKRKEKLAAKEKFLIVEQDVAQKADKG